MRALAQRRRSSSGPGHRSNTRGAHRHLAGSKAAFPEGAPRRQTANRHDRSAAAHPIVIVKRLAIYPLRISSSCLDNIRTRIGGKGRQVTSEEGRPNMPIVPRRQTCAVLHFAGVNFIGLAAPSRRALGRRGLEKLMMETGRDTGPHRLTREEIFVRF